jgi:cell division septation protein DedD
MSGEREGEGKQAFFWLAALVLGGLIFAAGVMVGRGLGQPTTPDARDPLTRLDEGNALPQALDGGAMDFPRVLEGPPVAAPRRPEPPDPDAGPVAREPPDAGAAPPAADAGLAVPPAADAGLAVPPAADAGLAVPPVADAGLAAAPAEARPTLCLQVASFRELSQAEALVHKLRAAGYPDVRVGSAEAGSKGTYYRVRAGRFSGREVAEQVRARLEREEHLKALVLTCEP